MAGGKKKNNKKTVLFLVAALILVTLGTVLFVGAVSGWFSGPAVAEIDSEFYCHQPKCSFELKNIETSEYEEMIAGQKSFVVVVYQGGCKTADAVVDFAVDYSNERKFQIFEMKFSDVKENSLGEYVKYYPSVAVISKGKVLSYLRADSDEDAPAYNTYSDFKAYLDRFVR